jgi:hypothetical protein
MEERNRRASDKNRTFDPRPESATGGASDSGAHGRHPASSPEIKLEGRSPHPEDDPGDSSLERRHRDMEFRGPERRIARQ